MAVDTGELFFFNRNPNHYVSRSIHRDPNSIGFTDINFLRANRACDRQAWHDSISAFTVLGSRFGMFSPANKLFLRSDAHRL